MLLLVSQNDSVSWLLRFVDKSSIQIHHLHTITLFLFFSYLFFFGNLLLQITSLFLLNIPFKYRFFQVSNNNPTITFNISPTLLFPISFLFKFYSFFISIIFLKEKKKVNIAIFSKCEDTCSLNKIITLSKISLEKLIKDKTTKHLEETNQSNCKKFLSLPPYLVRS